MLSTYLLRLETCFGIELLPALMREELEAHAAGLRRGRDKAAQVESLLQAYTRHLTEFMADGMLTLREKTTLAMDLLRLKRQARATTQHLDHLAS